MWTLTPSCKPTPSWRPGRSGLIAVFSTMVIGCATKENIPSYPLLDPPQAIETVRARAAEFQKFTGRGSVTLSSPQRGSVRLESVFVIAPPDFARIRGWKFNQAVFDLTVRPDGVWLFSPLDDKPSIDPGNNSIGDSVRRWLTYLTGDLSTADAEMLVDSKTIAITRRQPDGTTLETLVDRATLTIRRHRLMDEHRHERFRLTLDRYATFGQTVWPRRIEARSENGTITVETSELQPNVAADKAFTPPPRATRLP